MNGHKPKTALEWKEAIEAQIEASDKPFTIKVRTSKTDTAYIPIDKTCKGNILISALQRGMSSHHLLIVEPVTDEAGNYSAFYRYILPENILGIEKYPPVRSAGQTDRTQKL